MVSAREVRAVVACEASVGRREAGRANATDRDTTTSTLVARHTTHSSIDYPSWEEVTNQIPLLCFLKISKSRAIVE